MVGSFWPVSEVPEFDASENASFNPLAVDNVVGKVGSGSGKSAMEGAGNSAMESAGNSAMAGAGNSAMEAVVSSFGQC